MPTASRAEIVTLGGEVPSSTASGSNTGFKRQSPLRPVVTVRVVALLDAQRLQATGHTSATLRCNCVFHDTQHSAQVRSMTTVEYTDGIQGCRQMVAHVARHAVFLQ
jgi:hypothetical protein